MAAELDLGEFEALMSNAGIGIVVHDLDGQVVRANSAYARLLGYTLEEALQLRVDDVIREDGLLETQSEPRSTERQFIRRDGTAIWVRSRKSILHRGDASYVLVVVEDWTEQRERLNELERVAGFDWLTGVTNLSGLHAEIARRIDREEDLAVLMIDLNAFKSVNDSFGHRVGDEVLKHVANRLVAAAGRADTVARQSGDEFVIVTSPDDAALIAKQVHEGLVPAIGVELDGVPLLHLTASIGHADLINGMTPADLLDAADRDMYDHKRRHR